MVRSDNLGTGGGYTAAVKNIYGVPIPAPPEEHNKAIDSLQDISLFMQEKRHEMYSLSQSNAILASSKTTIMAQLTQLMATMGDM